MAYMLLALLTVFTRDVAVPGTPVRLANELHAPFASVPTHWPGSPGVFPAWIQSTLNTFFLDNFWLNTTMVAKGRLRSLRAGNITGCPSTAEMVLGT